MTKDEKNKRLKEIQLPMERKVIKHPDWEIAYPEKVTVVGFLVIMALSVSLIFLIKAIAWIGS